MRAWVLSLGVLVTIGCGSKSLEGDTGGIEWPESPTDNDADDADGATDDADGGSDADGGDDTGDVDAGADADADGGDDTGNVEDTGSVDPFFGFSLDVAAAIAGTPVGFSVYWMDGDEMTD